jgi:hypothetical protein
MEYKPEVLSQFGIGNDFAHYSKKVCIFIDGLWLDRKEFKDAEFRVFIGGCEPDILLDKQYRQQDVIDNHKKFDLILTRNTEIIQQCKNAKLFPFGSTWVSPKFQKLATNFEVSFLCGVKNYLPGHNLRQQVFTNLHRVRCNELTLKLNYTIDTKDRSFNTSQYAIIIENSQCENYFTEKLIDCLITKTIPIYWGCPNIGDFFDQRGIIKFTNLEDLINKINILTPEIYDQKLNIIESNYREAFKYANFHKRVDLEILSLLQNTNH